MSFLERMALLFCKDEEKLSNISKEDAMCQAWTQLKLAGMEETKKEEEKTSRLRAEIEVDRLLKRIEEHQSQQFLKRKEKLKNPQSIYLRKRVSRI